MIWLVEVLSNNRAAPHFSNQPAGPAQRYGRGALIPNIQRRTQATVAAGRGSVPVSGTVNQAATVAMTIAVPR